MKLNMSVLSLSRIHLVICRKCLNKNAHSTCECNNDPVMVKFLDRDQKYAGE